ncbi:MAG TPA: hypothetical protein VGE79_10210, partial [Niastella sp.]
MTKSENVYVFQEFEKDAAGVKYHFLSKGIRRIVKIVEYEYIGLVGGKRTYNLGFGSYNQIDNKIQDDEISANGDAYKVFNTVLSTIPHFLNYYPDVMIMVGGSDSARSFLEMCRLNCKKKCLPPVCKNAHRRIAIYKKFVNKNWAILTQEYNFWGGIKTSDY